MRKILSGSIIWMCSCATWYAVGDQEIMSSFTCMSPLRQILAFNLSSPPYMFNLNLHANFPAMISSAGSGFSFRRKVSLSNKPATSDMIASPHFSLINRDCRTSGMVG